MELDFDKSPNQALDFDKESSTVDKVSSAGQSLIDTASDFLSTPTAATPAVSGDYNSNAPIVHPQVLDDLVNEPVEPKVLELNYSQRRDLQPSAYVNYLDSLPDDKKQIAKEEDAVRDPLLNIEKVVKGSSILGFTKGLGDTVIKNPILGLAKLGSFFRPEVAKDVESIIVDFNKEVKNGEANYNGYKVGTMLGRNGTQVAAAFYAGMNIPLLVAYEGGASLIDNASKPAEGSDDSQSIAKTLGQGAVASASAGTAGLLMKLVPYVMRGFQSKNISEALNPNTELGQANYEQLKDAVEFAQENNIRLSELMVRQSGRNTDGVAMIENSNYMVLREMFKGSDDFAAKSLDMLEDMIKVGKSKADSASGTLSEKRLAQVKFQNEVKRLRDKYKAGEAKLWDKVSDSMPTGKIELSDFSAKLSSELTQEGIDPSVVTLVNKISSVRFKSGHKELTKQANTLRLERSKVKEEIVRFRKANGDQPVDEFVATLGKMQDKRKALDTQITELNKATRISPKDLMLTIKLLNKKINVPGGSISINDAQQIRGLRVAKARLEEELDASLKNFPEAKAALTEARDLTIQRVNSFGNSHTDSSLALTNALLNKDIGKVSTMLKDPAMGLEHMSFIRDNFGKDSEAFSAAKELFLRAKLGVDDSVMALADNSKLIGGVRGDASKISDKLSNITNGDIKFIKENFGEKFGKDLNGYMRLINQYDDLAKQLAKSTSGRGQMPAWQYGLKKPTEILSLSSDFIKYATVKGGQKLLNGLPVGRTIIGAGLPAIFGDENSDDYYKNIIVGAGVGYATGVAGRHLFEEQIQEVIRVLNNRKNPTTIMRAIARFRDKAKKLEKSIENKTILPDESLNKILGN